MAERMTIEGLRYAQAVGETGSFSAAARAFGVTQPALSASIAKLEEYFGEQLFTRSTRGVRPTAFGLAVLPLVHRALGAMDEVSAEANRWTAPPTSGIRMGISPLVDRRVVADAYIAVCCLSPTVTPRQLILREANMADLREGLAAGDLDIIVIPSVGPMPRYMHRLIDAEPVVLIGSAGREQDPVGVRDLAGAELILMPDTCGLTTFTRDLLDADSVPVRTYAGEAASYRVLEDWSGIGLGVALLPGSKVSAASVERRAVVDDEGAPVEIFYEAVWDPRSELATELAELAERLHRPRPGAPSSLRA